MMCFLFRTYDNVDRPHGWSDRPSPDREPSMWPTGPAGNYRVSDAEREAVATQLRRHVADGRLSMDEFDQRLGECLAAVTYDELHRVLRQLPPLPQRHPGVQVRQGFGPVVPVAVIVFAFLVVMAGVAATGHVFPFLPLVPLATWVLLRPWRAARWRAAPW
jgi:hypothetical protein